MYISSIKNVYINQLAHNIDKAGKQDGKLDIDEFAMLLDKTDKEKNNSKNFTKKEYSDLVKLHLNELGNLSHKDSEKAAGHFVNCLAASAGIGVIGGIIGACTKKSMERTMRSVMGGLFGLIAGFGLYIGYAAIDAFTNKKKQKDFLKSQKIEKMIYREFNCLNMSEKDRANFLINKCGYSHKAARSTAACSMSD